jgi:hypothetical protein
MKRAPILIVLVAACAGAQTFPASNVLPAAVPDGLAYCSNGAALTLTVPVAGVSAAVTSVTLNFTMAPAHTWYGDLKCVVTAPSGASAVVMEPFCEGSTDDASNVAGPYVLSDGGATLFDDAAVTALNGSTVAVPAGTYRPDNSLNALLGCGANGNWIIQLRDFVAGDTGSVSALSLTFGMSGAVLESFTICQGGAGQPVNLVHRGGPANGGYLNPAVVNTPSAVPNGWLYGLDIPVPLLLQELNTAPPIFAGTLDALGGSAVSVGGVPPGLTIQIVGIHLNGAGIPLFASAPVSFTVN